MFWGFSPTPKTAAHYGKFWWSISVSVLNQYLASVNETHFPWSRRGISLHHVCFVREIVYSHFLSSFSFISIVKSYTNKTKIVLNGFPSSLMNNISPLTCLLARGLGAWQSPVCCQLGFISQALCRDISFHQCSCSGESYEFEMLVNFYEVVGLCFMLSRTLGRHGARCCTSHG